ncbi:hypothetical protein [Cellulomonas sp. C5510]|uniref:hypothetical protein n=1 Tax=Cellulomonas sp. C5510 TaxID=2871170 RepID=UPI001C9815C3|nr:hypothetical protein [Cellulomonas sp. C5510]QZN86912.1 hypothetical protein K5O09_07315 [Cellulomonas sp. C5510]
MPDAQPKPTAAEVLTAHQDGHGYTHDDDMQCACGTWVGVVAGRGPFRDTPGRRSLAEHQADMLAAAGYPTTPEALAEHNAQVLRDAADEYEASLDALRFTPAAVHWLRARAARVAVGEEP